MKMDSMWEEQLSHRLKIERSLNFAAVPREEDDFGYSRKKTARDPMSHRIIEKRRRDRMNNCLADLSRLIPTAYLKKGRGRIEKTEIIEMAIKHLKHLQAHSCKDPNNCEVAKTVEQDRKYQYRLGFQECMSETLRFLVEIEGLYAGDGLCVRLVSHLQKHYDKIAGGMGFNQQTDFLGVLAEESRDTSMDVTSSPSHIPTMESFPSTPSLERATTPCRPESNEVVPPKMVTEPPREECPPSEGGSQLREMLQNPGLPKDMTRSSSYSMNSEHQKSEEVYKFKNNIKHRFNADLRHHTDYHEDDKSYLDLRGYSQFPPQSGVISPSAPRNTTQRSFRPTHISIPTSTTNELSIKVPDRTSENLQTNHWDSQADCGSSSCGSNPSPPSIPRSSGSSSGYSTGGDVTFAPRLRSHLQGRHSPGYPHTPPENNTNRSPSPQHNMKTGVPIFALHPKGAFYIPLTIDWAIVAQSFVEYDDFVPVLHPVSISVNFCRQVKLKMNGITSWEQRPYANDKCGTFSDNKTSLTFACATVNP